MDRDQLLHTLLDAGQMEIFMDGWEYYIERQTCDEHPLPCTRGLYDGCEYLFRKYYPDACMSDNGECLDSLILLYFHQQARKIQRLMSH